MDALLIGWTIRLDRLHQTSRKINTVKQGGDTPPPAIIPVAQPVTDNASIKQSLSMLSDSVDWDKSLLVFPVNQTAFATTTLKRGGGDVARSLTSNIFFLPSFDIHDRKS
ncbi:MAG: hypothetical protein EBU46_01995 [Nitrosomonadaceae bacterium]|nr:hypothetical protein [Nitrosomonadaceae bacterium]